MSLEIRPLAALYPYFSMKKKGERVLSIQALSTNKDILYA